jgi:hypothetical protein
VAPSFGLELRPVDVRDASEIEHAISSNDGVIVTASGLANVHRNLIVTLAARLPPLRHRRRPDFLRARCDRPVPARGCLRRSHPQGRETD